MFPNRLPFITNRSDNDKEKVVPRIWSRVRFPIVSLQFFKWHIPSGRTMAHGGDSASNRDEYRVYLLGVKCGRAGSIPDSFIRNFHWQNTSGRTMALGSTQPLTEISTRNIFWRGKSGRSVGLTTLPPSCADCLEIRRPQTSGTLRVCPGL
jgi:hypothetical protein